MIKSEFTTAVEKQTLTKAKNTFFRLNFKFPDGSGRYPSCTDNISGARDMKDLDDIVANDAKTHGLYVPPMMILSTNNDGTVKKTHVMNKHGTTTTYQGGIVGVSPGAPEGFVMRNQRSKAGIFDAREDRGNKVGYGRFQLSPSDIDPMPDTSFPKATNTPTVSKGKTSAGKGK